MRTDELIADVLAEHSDVAEHLLAAHDAAFRATDPGLLELCRLRVAMLLGCEAELEGTDAARRSELAAWPTSPQFDDRERACLAFCEQFVVDVAGMDAATATAVADHLGQEGLVDFANALLVIEQRQRLRLAWERVL